LEKLQPLRDKIRTSGLTPKAEKLHTVGSCIDIEERDIVEIFDATTQEQLFVRKESLQ